MGRKNQATGTKSAARVAWTNEQFNLFVDICVRGTNLGKRSGGGWGYKGWLWVGQQMNAAGLDFTKMQLKHKWDWMNGQWKLWKELIGKETKLEWDRPKGTIIASDEWWNEKTQKNSDFSKLREKGIGQDLYLKYEAIFMGTMVNGEHMNAPSFSSFPYPIANVSMEKTGDSHEGFEDNLERRTNDVTILGNSSTQGASRTVDFEENRANAGQATKRVKVNEAKKQQSSATQLSNTMKEVKESGKGSKEIKISPLFGHFGDRPGTSIAEVMEDVLSLPNMEEGSELHLFSTLLLEKKAKREMYATLKTSDGKWKWLQYHHNLWTNGKWKLEGQ